MIKAGEGVNQVGQTEDDATWVTIASIDTSALNYGEDFDELTIRATADFLGRSNDHLSAGAQRAGTIEVTGGTLTKVAEDLVGTFQSPPELANVATRINVDGATIQAQAKGVDGKIIDWNCALKLQIYKP